ncbi:hypothetical protein [Variovorax sp. OV329]|uniref:hypothetical protein n=1 Tax=Variovorax sp. OV329 TaxID=1882825 RepID=UPI0008EED900|nr:hypothetical protein [Variovorax sp. OV329]SFM67138.1 hypothetical protein SAMN05444747_107252 [Variovorax sp. OV329]
MSELNPNPGNFSDTDLAELAHHWRARALRGEREAFGLAQSFEVEQRRRLRDSFYVDLEPVTTEYQTDRPWWKFW